jgi:hypothetical protein
MHIGKAVLRGLVPTKLEQDMAREELKWQNIDATPKLSGT